MIKKIILIFLIFSTFGITTYAWFTITSTVTVDEISVNVQAADGLLISVDGVNWGARITTEMLEPFLAQTLGTPTSPQTRRLIAVTPSTDTLMPAVPTAFGAGLLSLTVPERQTFNTVGMGGAESPVTPGANGGWIEFPLFFRTIGAAETAVAWVQNGSEPVISGSGTGWQSDLTFAAVPGRGELVASGQLVDFDVASAARVSIGSLIYEKPAVAFAPGGGGNAAWGNNVLGDGSSVGALDLTYDAGVYTNLWGGHEFFHRRVGFTGAPSIFTTAAARLSALYTASTNLFDDSNGVITAVGQDVWVAIPNQTISGFSNAAKVIVRVWLEGWDFDTFDIILTEQLTVNLAFQAVPITL